MDSGAPSGRAAHVVFEDGIGERLSAVGGANEPLEVLKIGNELSAVPAFEPSLREQALRLTEFRHEAFARVRGVERLDAHTSTVVVISERVRGVRLSELLSLVEREKIPIELDAALCLIRQLVSAVAALHETDPDCCHGAIAPERLVITPEGKLVLVEYVLGPALEALHFSQERYWRELGIALPHSFGLPRFDPLADVTQAGAVSLALLLGRRLTADEYPAGISDMVDEASTRGELAPLSPLPVLLRAWLRNALQLEPRHSFVSGVAAKHELESALSQASPDAERAALRNLITQYVAVVLADRAAAPAAVPAAVPAAAEPALPPAPLIPVTPASRMMEVPPAESVVIPPAAVEPPVDLFATDVVIETPVTVSEDMAIHVPVPAPVEEPTRVPIQPRIHTEPVQTAMPATAATSVGVPLPAAPAPEPPRPARENLPKPPSTPPPSEEPRPAAQAAKAAAPGRPLWMSPWAMAAAVLLVMVTLGFTMMGPRGAAPLPATTGRLTVGTNPDGVAVFVDGASRGTTPLNVSLPAGDHVLELVTPGERRRIPVSLAAGSQVSQYFELARTPSSESGSLQIRSDPPNAKVTVDGRTYGRTPTAVNGLMPGSHRVLLESDTDKVSEDVVIEAGATASLVVPMGRQPVGTLSGWIAVTVPAEVQIYENARLLGTSRTDRIMLAVGRHQLEFVNEPLGYRGTRAVEVTNGQVAAVRPEWPRGSVALNALPWAEVFVDGERVGETPIGGASLPIGVHEVVFRHPELGERKASAIVTTGAPARLSVDMRTK